jgi:predicted dehydrogenase
VVNVKRHRVAIAGLGGVAQGAHLPAYQALGERLGIEVVGGAEPDDERRAAITAIPTFASVEQMLAEARPEVVDVTVQPGPAKAAVIRQCLDAGCHVLAQKPFMKDLGEAAALVDYAKDKGRHLAVNVQARFAPAFRAARDLVAEGAIGTPLSAFITSTFPLAGQHMAVEMGIHEMDLLRFWLGLDPVRVRASATDLRDGRCHIVMEADFGSATGLIVEENHGAVVRPWSFRILGSDGTIEGQEQFGTVEPAWLVVHKPGAEAETVALEYAYLPDAFALVMGSLLEAIDSGRPAPTSAEDHLSSLAGVLAAERSLRSGTFEKVETL